MKRIYSASYLAAIDEEAWSKKGTNKMKQKDGKCG
jgi:hypothetical protein